MGAVIAAAIWGFIADMSLAVTALLALAVFISGILILTGIGGQGVQKNVRGAFLAIFLGAWFCLGANRMATKFAADFKTAAAGGGAPPPTTMADEPIALGRPAVYDVRQARA